MFASALGVARGGELLLGRDRLGIKPLYYAELPDRLLFASELKALLAVWPGEPALDPGALVEYLQHHFNTGERSLGRGIRREPPGAALVVDTELRMDAHRYRSPPDGPSRQRPFEQAAEAFDP